MNKIPFFRGCCKISFEKGLERHTSTSCFIRLQTQVLNRTSAQVQSVLRLGLHLTLRFVVDGLALRGGKQTLQVPSLPNI